MCLRGPLGDFISVDLLQQTLKQDCYDEIKYACGVKAVSLTQECHDLLKRIDTCPPSIRRLLMNFVEFPDDRHFDPFLHNDYGFIHGIVFHLIKVLHGDLENSKMDGLGLKRKKSLVILIELAKCSFFESLTKYKQYYVRDRHLKLPIPQTSRDLKSFAALLLTLLSWRQAVVDSV
ncbi:hypothetical protein INT47_012597, partial [Mucor saturninus]